MKKDKLGRFVETEKSFSGLLEHESVKEWYEGLISENTKKQYMWLLDRLLSELEITPDQFLELPPKEARDLAWKIIKRFRSTKPVTAATLMACIRSFYRSKDGVKLPFDSRRGGKHYIRRIRKKIEIEHIPTKEEVYLMADMAGNLRDNSIILSSFQSGIRVNASCNLRFKHVKDQLYPEVKIPIRLRITQFIDTKLQAYELTYYYTFLQEEAVVALRRYCDKFHEDMNGEKFLYYSDTGRKLDRTSVLMIVKKCARRAGLNPKTIWTHLLRKSFRKVLNASPIDDDTREAIMGHRIPGSRENYFDRHDVDEVASKYMKCGFGRTFTEVGKEMIVKGRDEIAELRKQVAMSQVKQAELEETVQNLVRFIKKEGLKKGVEYGI